MKRLLGILLLGAMACAPRQTVQEETASAPPETLTVVDTIQVETVTVSEEPVITFDETPTQPAPETSSTTAEPAPQTPMNPPAQPAYEPAPPATPQVRKVPGFRVQVFASMYRDKAEAFRDGIVAQWGVKAYVVEEYDPARGLTLYKVRVGNFLDRASAESMRDRIRSLWGYTDAFVVQDQVEVQR